MGIPPAERRSSGGRERRAGGLAVCVVAVLILTPVAPLAGEQQELKAEEKVVREFAGKVIAIVSIHDYSGKAIAVDVDPGWIVRLKVTKADTPGMEQLGAELTYIIHSPVQTFLVPAEDVIGREFRFREILWLRPDGTPGLRKLEARAVDTEKQKEQKK